MIRLVGSNVVSWYRLERDRARRSASVAAGETSAARTPRKAAPGYCCYWPAGIEHTAHGADTVLEFVTIGVASMCDYSLHLVASRPAKVGEKLVSTRFPNTSTRGFASVDERNVAVCLLPGTELAFEQEVQCETAFVLRSKCQLGYMVAQFRQVNKGQSDVHHDALEFPDGQIVLLTYLCEGQHAIVLQLPASPRIGLDAAQRQDLLAV